jgi:hypothetical protein
MGAYFRKLASFIIAMALLSGMILGANGLEPGDLERKARGPVRSFVESEPAAIAFLTAGLVSLGIYARRKQRNRRSP